MACLALALGAFACAKSPASNLVPYDGYVGKGPDWDADVAQVVFTVDPANVGRPISPLIYGYNNIANPGQSGVASLRLGGNRWTAFNWENGASNGGKDYMYENDNNLLLGSTMPTVPGAAVIPTLQTAQTIGAAVILTVPNVDYLSADLSPGGDVRSDPNYLTTRFDKNMPTKGSAFSLTPDLTDGVVYQDEFVNWAMQSFPGVQTLFAMDNEPDLWFQTHPEVHPAKVGYDELIMRNTEYAQAVKSVWPTAGVLGFVSFGWAGYGSLNGAPDSLGRDFITYYLQQMKKAETTAGLRLIDYLDLHWYPEATGPNASGTQTRVAFSTDISPGVSQARLQAPRSLWDPGYVETSYITGSTQAGIALIPRMQAKIDANYPGTKLAITEWDYGAGGDISGGVTTADVLGVFGREGMGAANIWPSGSEPFNQAAIRVYRNFTEAADGNGQRFGDTSVSAETTSIFSTSVYASTDTTDPTRLVIVAINKRASSTTATVNIAGSHGFVGASVWTLAGATAKVQPAAPLAAATPDTFTYVMPALSVSVLVPSTSAVAPGDGAVTAPTDAGADGGDAPLLP